MQAQLYSDQRIVTESSTLENASGSAIEFQLQVAVPAEDLHCSCSSRELRRLASRVHSALTCATELATVLEPRGWCVRTIRFDDEIAVVLVKRARAQEVVADLAALPLLPSKFGETVHLCATLGEHVFELAMTEHGLRPLDEADSVY